MFSLSLSCSIRQLALANYSPSPGEALKRWAMSLMLPINSSFARLLLDASPREKM